MRGKDSEVQTTTDRAGITPAYAGKSPLALRSFRDSGDHPRVCGEKIKSVGRTWLQWGSPPRMRGKVFLLYSRVPPRRITPAYAGKRRISLYRALSPRDHPRVCGEKPLRYPKGMEPEGSPPRMRGKGLEDFQRHLFTGITPAYAGKSPASDTQGFGHGDHPRVCGEKRGLRGSGLLQAGSPPRMRGKAHCRWPFGFPPGITPAYAGKRLAACPEPKAARDHPRVCGEKGLVGTGSGNITGSPPRMRGKVLEESTDLYHLGITPAYAGKSWMSRYHKGPKWDHPRVCGEKTKKIP